MPADEMHVSTRYPPFSIPARPRAIGLHCRYSSEAPFTAFAQVCRLNTDLFKQYHHTPF